MESTTRWTPCQLSRLLHLSQISLQNKKNCVAKCVIGCSCQVQIVFLPQKDVKNRITLARFKNSLSICLNIFFNYWTIFWLFVQRIFCFMLRILNSKRVLIRKISRKRYCNKYFSMFREVLWSRLQIFIKANLLVFIKWYLFSSIWFFQALNF